MGLGPGRPQTHMHFVCAIGSALLSVGGLGIWVEAASSAPPKKHRVVQLASAVNLSDPRYATALAQYQSDPFRTEPWAGDHYPNENFQYAMLNNCATGGADGPPSPIIKYARSSKVLTVTFQSRPVKYCDLMGATTESIIVRKLIKKKNGHYKHQQVGATMNYQDGMAEALAHYMSPDDAKGIINKTIAVQDIGNLCLHGRRSKTRLQVLFRTTFYVNANQTFQHPEHAGVLASKDPQSGRADLIYRTIPKNVCK